MPLLQRLKSETQHQHQQLETCPGLQLLTSPAITAADYARILKQFYGFFAPLEQQLSSFPGLAQHLPDFPTRRKADLLLRDLEVIEGQLPKAGSLPLAADLPSVQNTSEAFGCLYVMEGSTLGGRFISKNLQAALGLSAGSGARFFNGYGTETGARWTVFREALHEFNRQTPSEDQIVNTANSTFAKLNTWFRL